MADADDVLKNAGRFFSKLGGQLKDVGQKVGSQAADLGQKVGAQVADVGQKVGAQVVATSKQVTGLGRGEVKVELFATNVAPGGSLKGRVVLALRERVEAKRVLVTLRAHQRMTTSVKRADGSGVGATFVDVYQFDKELAPSGTYEPEQAFEFELAVPLDALTLRPPEPAPSANPLADVARTIATAVTPDAGPIEWQVVGRLEIAWGRDLASETDISIT